MTAFLTALASVAAVCITVGWLVGQQVLAIEIQGWMQVLSRRIVERAVLRLPECHRLRYEEEWSAELAALKSRPISGLAYSCWVLTQARRTGSEAGMVADELSDSSPVTRQPMARITVGDVWDALEVVGIRPEGVGLGSAYFRLPDDRLLKFPNRGFFDHGIASDELLAVFASWGACPTASGRYPMPADANEWVRRPRDPMFVEHRRT